MQKKILNQNIIKILFFSCFFILFIFQCSLYATERLPYVEGEMLIKFKTHEQQDFRKRHIQNAKKMNLDILKYYPINNIYLVKTKDIEPFQAVLKKLKKSTEIEYVEPNYIRYKMTVTPDDTFFTQQWGLQNIHVPEAWDIEKGEKKYYNCNC